MTNWTIFKIIFFHFYLYSSVLSHIYFLHIKNPLYSVKKTSNIEKTLFSLNIVGAVFSKITNSNAQKWVIFRNFFPCKINLTYIGNFLGCVLFDIPKKHVDGPPWCLIVPLNFYSLIIVPSLIHHTYEDFF